MKHKQKKHVCLKRNSRTNKQTPPVKPRANRLNMLANNCPTCWDGLTCQTAPTSKNDENVGEMFNIIEHVQCWRLRQHVGVMDNMLAKHATSMSNRPNMLGRFARGFTKKYIRENHGMIFNVFSVFIQRDKFKKKTK